MNQKKEILSVENLSVLFESNAGFIRAVDNVSFSLEENKILSIIGESGSGKTVLLSSICGIIKGSPGIISGRIRFKSQDLLENINDAVKVIETKDKIKIKKNEYSYSKMLKNTRDKIRSEISMVFQDPRKSLDPLFTIEEQMLEALKINPEKKLELSKNNNIDEMVTWLQKVNINNPLKVLKQFPFELSGGMLQRVMLAISMIVKPSIIIADEPTTALDISTAVKIIDLLQEIHEDTNSSIIFVTHDISLAEKISNQIIVMNSGQIVEYGNNQNIFHNNYKHPYTRALFKSRLQPFKTNRQSIIFYMKDREPEESLLSSGCKFRIRCEFSDYECSVKNENIKLNENHYINCKNIQSIGHDD